MSKFVDRCSIVQMKRILCKEMGAPIADNAREPVKNSQPVLVSITFRPRITLCTS